MARVNQVLWDLREQYRSERDPELALKIRKEFDRVFDILLSVAGKDLKNNTAKFEAASKKLASANKALKKARMEIQNIEKAINRLAKVIDALAEIVSMAT